MHLRAPFALSPQALLVGVVSNWHWIRDTLVTSARLQQRVYRGVVAGAGLLVLLVAAAATADAAAACAAATAASASHNLTHDPLECRV